LLFFFSSRRRHTRSYGDWSSDVCSSDLYLDFIGFCDIRPSQQERAIKEFTAHEAYGKSGAGKLKKYADEKEMLADPDVEMVVIRSEERRVGKEGRCRRWGEDWEKKEEMH